MVRPVAVLVAFGLVTSAAAECWLRSDGVRICSADGLEWMVMWWFWFAVLFFLCACTGGSYIYHRRNVNALYQQGFVTYSEPLILHDHVQTSTDRSAFAHKIFYQ